MENKFEHLSIDELLSLYTSGEPLLKSTFKEVILPNKETENAGYDVYAFFEEEELKIEAHQTKLIPTGLFSCVSEDYVLLARERGSTGSIGMKCGAGVIDSGYRGEIFIAITNENNIPLIRIPYNIKWQESDLILNTTHFLLTKENERNYYNNGTEEN